MVGEVQSSLFNDAAEKALAQALEKKAKKVAPLFKNRKYTEMLTILADLQGPVDQFFEHVMVMVDESDVRRNRLLLLQQLRDLFLQVADISLLQDQ